MSEFTHAQVIWLGSLAPQWAKDIEKQREIWTGNPFQPFNGYGRILTQFGDIVELQVMVGKPNGCWDARVVRYTADELTQNQSADIQKWRHENGWR